MVRKTLHKDMQKKKTKDRNYILTNRVLSNSFSILKIRTRKCKLMKASHMKLKKKYSYVQHFGRWGVAVPLRG
jgi:hypothetical protein